MCARYQIITLNLHIPMHSFPKLPKSGHKPASKFPSNYLFSCFVGQVGKIQCENQAAFDTWCLQNCISIHNKGRKWALTLHQIQKFTQNEPRAKTIKLLKENIREMYPTTSRQHFHYLPIPCLLFNQFLQNSMLPFSRDRKSSIQSYSLMAYLSPQNKSLWRDHSEEKEKRRSVSLSNGNGAITVGAHWFLTTSCGPPLLKSASSRLLCDWLM